MKEENINKEDVNKENIKPKSTKEENVNKESIKNGNVKKENMKKENIKKENREKENIKKENIKKENREKENIKKENMKKENMKKENKENVNIKKENIKKGKIISVLTEGCEFSYEIEKICRLFFPEYKFLHGNKYNVTDVNSDFLYINIDKSEQHDIILNTVVTLGEKTEKTAEIVEDVQSDKGDIELKLSSILFKTLSRATGEAPSWGIVTGVRPVKAFRSLLKRGGIEYSREYFKNKLFVNESKIDLVEQIVARQQKILDLSVPKSFSLYVSIPFCPSRCSYCSFVSQTVERSARLVPVYLDLLTKELDRTADIVESRGLKLETVYVGGGTPTTLSPSQLETLINYIKRSFNTETVREFTIEAGRPDVLDDERLTALKSAGPVRISVNPQTFDDGVLRNIGRKHTSAQTLDAYSRARRLGFSNVNMDLIAGLPGDGLEKFRSTLEKTLSLSPEGITIHTLAIKKSAKVDSEGPFISKERNKAASDMLSLASSLLPAHGYRPYYLYRQSKTLGNMENVGWAKEGFESLYNVYIMEETHSILACGAGAVTKLKDPFGDYIERVFNFKYVYEYVSRFDEILERKRKVERFYDKL